MRSGQRLCALVVVLALLAALPLGTPRRCPECPPGCPMHAPHAANGARAGKQPGCHRTTPTPTGIVCLRSACGHHPATEAPVALTAVLPRTVRVHSAGAATLIAPDEPRFASVPAPDPPTDPPRPLHA
jgi:hypothetical protein